MRSLSCTVLMAYIASAKVHAEGVFESCHCDGDLGKILKMELLGAFAGVD